MVESCEHYLNGCFAIGDILALDKAKGEEFMEAYCLNKENSENCLAKQTMTKDYQIAQSIREAARKKDDHPLALLVEMGCGLLESLYPEMWETKRKEVEGKKEYEALKEKMLESVEG